MITGRDLKEMHSEGFVINGDMARPTGYYVTYNSATVTVYFNLIDINERGIDIKQLKEMIKEKVFEVAQQLYYI